MSNVLRLASASALLIGLAVASQGCIIGECDSGDPNCIQLETGTWWYGTEITESLPYTAGQNITVDAINGYVHLIRGTSTDTVGVRLMPFSYRADDEEAVAQDDMNNDLVTEYTSSGGEVLIVTDRTPEGSGGLGADVEITLPAGFTGGIAVDNGNGAIEADLSGGTPAFTTLFIGGAGDIWAKGAQGPLDIVSPFEADVQVAGWSTEPGRIKADRDTIVRVAPGLSGQIIALAGSDAAVTGPSGGEWTEVVVAGNHKEYAFGPNADAMGVVQVSIDSFAYANVTIIAE